jgi:MFS superfamily sulfate permease-like transporter
VVLLAGMGLACLIAVFEFIWRSRKMTTGNAETTGEERVRIIGSLNYELWHMRQYKGKFTEKCAFYTFTNVDVETR